MIEARDDERLLCTWEVPLVSRFDVVVVGGGPSGLSAAVAAARLGATVALVERYGFLGGNLTAGLVGPCMTSFSLDGKRQLIGGIFEEFVQRMMIIGGAVHPSQAQAGSAYAGFIDYGHDKVTPFEPEAAKLVSMEMCLDAGVHLFLHTLFLDSVVHEKSVTGVVCANKTGLVALRSSVTVDCSADGDVAARAGATAKLGREADGMTQPMTLFFRVSGIDDKRVEEYVRAHPEDERPFAALVAGARAQHRFPSPRRGVGLYKTLVDGVWRINTTRVLGLSGINGDDLTAAELEGRRQVRALVEFFRSDLPGFERCELLDTAVTIGVRETRRIVGDYTLTAADLASGRQFPDVVALAGYPIDIHDPTGDGGGVNAGYHTANVYEIPYRILLPAGVEQLLVAGRCVSATHEALGAIRVMPPSFAMGQAAGVASALAASSGVSPRAIPVSELQLQLLRQGALLRDEGESA